MQLESRLTPQEMIERFRDPKWGAAQLKNLPIFARFTDLELAQLYSMGELVKLRPKSNAVIEGEQTRGLYILLDGTVSVYKADPVSGSMGRLAILESGAHFGELSLFDYAPRSATVMAENTCHLFHLDADEFRNFLTAQGENLQVRFYRTCAEDLVERFRQLNADYMAAQQLLWKYALRRNDGEKPEISSAVAKPTQPAPPLDIGAGKVALPDS